jgi:CRISPR/Cas system type I-B associated protein Csh2 (Cas7 group RAMP superfamily)
MASNNVPELVKKYGKQITFMGGIDNKAVDFTGWTQEDCRKIAREVCDSCGSKYFIPCITQGGPGSVYPGTYMALTEEIDKYSQEVFGIKESDITRLPIQLLFG